MTLWPFCPVPQFSESLAWSSGVLGTYEAEQRQRFTDAPRQMLAYPFAMNFRQLERAKLLMENGAAADWQIPVWAERQRITLNSGAGSIPIDTTTSDYRAGGEAMLWQSDERYEVVAVDAVNAGSLDIAGTTFYGYANGFVSPVRTARCVDGLDASRTVQKITPVSTDWIVYDNCDLSDAGLYATYRGHPVITDCPRIGDGSFNERISREQDAVDNGLATPFFDPVTNRPTRTGALGWMPRTRAELWDLRTFLHALYGRQKGFWNPTWTRGIELLSAVGPSDTSITIRSVGLNLIAEAGDLMLQTKAGVKHFLQYTSVTPSGSTEVLALSGAAGFSVAPGDVKTLCRMHFSRLAQDRIEITHQHTGRGQISTIVVDTEEAPIP